MNWLSVLGLWTAVFGCIHAQTGSSSASDSRPDCGHRLLTNLNRFERQNMPGLLGLKALINHNNYRVCVEKWPSKRGAARMVSVLKKEEAKQLQRKGKHDVYKFQDMPFIRYDNVYIREKHHDYFEDSDRSSVSSRNSQRRLKHRKPNVVASLNDSTADVDYSKSDLPYASNETVLGSRNKSKNSDKKPDSSGKKKRFTPENQYDDDDDDDRLTYVSNPEDKRRSKRNNESEVQPSMVAMNGSNMTQEKDREPSSWVSATSSRSGNTGDRDKASKSSKDRDSRKHRDKPSRSSLSKSSARSSDKPREKDKNRSKPNDKPSRSSLSMSSARSADKRKQGDKTPVDSSVSFPDRNGSQVDNDSDQDSDVVTAIKTNPNKPQENGKTSTIDEDQASVLTLSDSE